MSTVHTLSRSPRAVRSIASICLAFGVAVASGCASTPQTPADDQGVAVPDSAELATATFGEVNTLDLPGDYFAQVSFPEMPSFDDAGDLPLIDPLQTP